VLDVGCGGGQVALHLARHRPDLQITGIDQAPGQVARARRRAAGCREAEAGRVVFRQGDALDLPFATGTFDLVLSVASIKHWPDRRAGLMECLRVLAPGGTLAIVEVERGCRLQDARRFVASWRYLPARLRRLFLALFYTYVAGQSIDLDEARQLAAIVPLAEMEVRRVPGSPALMIRGRKPG
jgi:SAM-dependent methyltransferase